MGTARVLGQAPPSLTEGGRALSEDVPKKERIQLGAIPVTSVRRTLLDCVSSYVSLELIEAALRQARARGFIDEQDVRLIQARARGVTRYVLSRIVSASRRCCTMGSLA